MLTANKAVLCEERGSAIKGLLMFVFLGLIGLVALAYIFGTIIPPGMMGVRQINFGPSQGFSKSGLAPGYHWVIPFYSSMHILPQKVEVISLDRESFSMQVGFPPLKVQTLNGAEVNVDISLFRRIFPSAEAASGENQGHGGPAELIKNVGLTRDAWDNNIKLVVEDELRRELGKLTTGDFYNPDRREQAVSEAFKSVNNRVANFGMKLEALLLRRYTYGSEQIDNAIFQKNLQEQEERLNSSSSKLAEARATLEQVSAEWDAKIRTLEIEGENKAQVARSEADLFESQKKAEGDLEVARAKAEIDRLRAGALSQTEGARNYVARQMTPLLGSLKGGLVSGVDPYNLEAWMKKLGITAK